MLVHKNNTDLTRTNKVTQWFNLLINEHDMIAGSAAAKFVLNFIILEINIFCVTLQAKSNWMAELNGSRPMDID